MCAFVEISRTAKGTIGLSCKKGKGRISRHSSVNDIICRALNKCNLSAIREPINISRVDGKRPDGITLVPWSHGKSLMWDATIPNTLARSYIRLSSKLSGNVARMAESKKRAKYFDFNTHYNFIPLAFESLESWGDDAKNLINKIGSKLSLISGDLKETCYLKQHISVAVQSGNTASILGTFRPQFN